MNRLVVSIPPDGSTLETVVVHAEEYDAVECVWTHAVLWGWWDAGPGPEGRGLWAWEGEVTSDRVLVGTWRRLTSEELERLDRGLRVWETELDGQVHAEFPEVTP